ncbi:MAG: SpoIIE family protein phosphatase [Chlorobi bacterium]|nr:SpoIIE family protein phosphatase [Chlorobiota bacterium]
MRKYTIVLLFVISISSYSQINKLGQPFVINYTPREYKANEQNWAIVQDKRGIMYFGNNDNGILEYDGTFWRNIPVKNNSIIRSLAIDTKGIIYYGAIGEFGFLEPDKAGQLNTHSLSVKLDSIQKQFTDVWKIYTSNKAVYFCTFGEIFKYANDTIVNLPLPENSFFTYIDSNKIYLNNLSDGLLYIDDSLPVNQFSLSKFQKIIGGEKYVNEHILSFLPVSKGFYIIGTFAHGVFKYDTETGESIQLKSNKIGLDMNVFLRENSIFHGIQLKNKNLAFATYQKGVVIIHNNSKIKLLIDKTTGLQDETVNFLYKNKFNGADGQLWVALNRGISRIEVNSPIRVFKNQINVNDVIKFNNIFYEANDLGVSYLTYNNDYKADFKSIELANGQSWKFIKFKTYSPENKIVNKKLLIAASNGILEIAGMHGFPIAKNYDSRTIYQSISYRNRLYVGFTDGLALIEYNNGKWIDKGKIDGINEMIQSIAEDTLGNLWLGTYINGVIRLKIADTTINHYTENDGLNSTKDVQIYNFDNRMFFTTQNGLYKFNYSLNKFEPDTFFGGSFANGSKGIYRLNKDAKGNFWAVVNKHTKYWIEKIELKDKNYIVNAVQFKRLPNMSFQTIYNESDSITWIGGSEGLYSFNNNISVNYKQPFHALIRKVLIDEDSVLFSGTNYALNDNNERIVAINQPYNSQPVLPFKYNSVTFEFSAPFFIEENATVYSHNLHGFDKSWTKWSSENKAVFTNLNEGNYSFRVKAKNIYGVESKVAQYNFIIKPPLYRTILAYVLYLILFIVFIRFLIQYNTRRLQREKLVLERIVKKRTAEVVKQKEEIEMAYRNVKMLSEIGQDVTANLSVEKIVEIVFLNVNKLMDASIFAIGLYNAQKNVLDFLGKESKDGELLKSVDSLSNEKQLSVWCFNNQKEIVLNNSSENKNEFKFYKSNPNEIVRESLIYLPLTVKKKKIGIITVQSHTKNAYSNNHVNILKNLAVYTAIALDNADAYQQIEEQKEEILHQNEILFQQKEEITAQKDEIVRQRDIVVKQKQEITDSILYAKRIQNAVLPPQELLDTLPEYFIFFKPRDIVSGDFYWMKKIQGLIVITVADCTGHGVPGAFMSMLGIALLNEIVRKKKISTASDVLNELRKQVKLALRQTGKQDEAKDGMDISLCVIDLENRKFNYAGAYNPLYIYRKINTSGEPYTSPLPVLISNDKYQLIEIKADKMPIGIHIKEKDSFTDHQFDIMDGDTFYMFSDGFIDQMGGEKSKKFMTKPFKKLLLEIQDMNMVKQKNILENKLNEWEKWPDENGQPHEQIDDITIIGLRF